MNMLELILNRKSVRSFDGRKLDETDLRRLQAYVAGIHNPYNIPVRFVWLDAEANGLASPVIRGERLYVAGKVPRVRHCEEAFGYSFEKLVLYARRLGIGTTWIGGTMDRALFEKAACTGEDEYMMIVSPLGYPAQARTDVERRLRESVHADERLPASELFFDRDFSQPLTEESSLLEAVRWAPSAANQQPCRVVKEANHYHFYVKHSLPPARWDVQKIDVGIAICNLMSVEGGRFSLSDPGIAHGEELEYIATVRI